MGQVFLELGNGADIAGVEFGHFGSRLALHHLGVLEAFGRAKPVVRERGVALEHAGHDFEVVDPPGEWVREGLEDKQGQRFRIAHSSFHRMSLAAGLARSVHRAARP